MVANSTTFPVRLSPSGPEIGNPPAQIGVGDGSGANGRCWRAQGYGNVAQVPGTAAGDVAGLGTIPVNLQTLYNYDVQFTGFVGGTGAGYKAIILGSHDNGATYPIVLHEGPKNDAQGGGQPQQYIARNIGVSVASNVVIDHVKVQWQKATAADAACTYDPTDCSIVIQEWSLT
jgi:hypothetical protein